MVLVHHPVGPLLVEVLVGVQQQNLFAANLPAVDHHQRGISGLVPHSDCILRRVHMPLLKAQELRWKKCLLRPLSVIPKVLSNTGFSVRSWQFHNIIGMLQSLVSLFINCQIIIAFVGLRLKRKTDL